MRTNIEKILVFQQSRVKDYNFDEWKAERSAENKTKSKNGEKARAFLLQPKNVRRNSSNSKNSKVKKTEQRVQANKSIR